PSRSRVAARGHGVLSERRSSSRPRNTVAGVSDAVRHLVFRDNEGESMGRRRKAEVRPHPATERTFQRPLRTLGPTQKPIAGMQPHVAPVSWFVETGDSTTALPTAPPIHHALPGYQKP